MDCIKKINKDDYLLALWFQGVSVFIMDIHNTLYKNLEALFIIDNGMFKQYFTKKAYNRSLEEGIKFYGNKYTFDNYKKNLSNHCDNFKKFFKSEIKNKKYISKKNVMTFFEYTMKLCADYTKMNFEFTDKAFIQQGNNPIIKNNLSNIGPFKDKIRNFMNMILFESNGYLHQFFVILAKQFNLSLSTFDNLTQKEVLELFDNKKPDEQKIFKRQEAFAESYNLNGFCEGNDAKVILKIFKEDIFCPDIIKGQIANKGKVIGKVKIISVDYSDLNRVNEDIKKMQQGNILIAETTAPELIIACKKAVAIVTDVGGLLSHAAIVSREFGIPCIVGTKNATKAFKDGDIVEVDANIGVVKKIKYFSPS